MKIMGDHGEQSTPIVNPLRRLQRAWEASLPGDEWASETIPLFHEEVRRILDQTKLTQPWYVPGSDDNDTEVNQEKIEDFKKHGALPDVKAFRRRFWNRNAAALLRLSIDRGTPFLGGNFWHCVFPEKWLADTSSHPPQSPSRHAPADLYSSDYAHNEEYLHWADVGYRQRLAELNPIFHRAALDCPYDPDDKTVFEQHACILSGAAALIMAEWLGLNEGDGEKLAARLDVVANVQFRTRKERHVLWPPIHKRPYVDLWLEPVLAQVLIYQTDDWESPLVRRSLPLKENQTHGYKPLYLLQLNRIDIEMAAWCEVVRRLLDSMPPAKPDSRYTPDHDMEILRHDPQTPMNAFDRLLPHQVPLAEAILRATQDLASPAPGAARFAPPDPLPLRRGLEGPGIPVADGIFLLPPEVTTPVLEDDRFFCQLDWQLIAPEGDWMDIRLFVLPANGGPAEYLEYEEVETEEDSDDSPVCLQLQGDVWNRLAAAKSAATLAAAFGRAVFGFRPSRLGTGAFVLGVIDLNQGKTS